MAQRCCIKLPFDGETYRSNKRVLFVSWIQIGVDEVIELILVAQIHFLVVYLSMLVELNSVFVRSHHTFAAKINIYGG